MIILFNLNAKSNKIMQPCFSKCKTLYDAQRFKPETGRKAGRGRQQTKRKQLKASRKERRIYLHV